MNFLLSIGYIFDKKLRNKIKSVKTDTSIDLINTPVPLKYLKKYINKNVQILKLKKMNL